jgi:hypothetical protein
MTLSAPAQRLSARYARVLSSSGWLSTANSGNIPQTEGRFSGMKRAAEAQRVALCA